MKVSIKNLHITFMGNDEPKVTTAPAEFYSQYERELRQELEKSRSEGVHVSDQLANVRRSAEAMDAELKLIAAWVKGYDEGEWPDHNAKGLGHVSGEVLHMIRDFQADIESRPLPGIGRWTDTPPAPVQPSNNADPVGLGQPEPETVQTQPAAPESAPVKAATAYIDAQARRCPVEGCSVPPTHGQELCLPHYTTRNFSAAINTSDPQQHNVRPIGDTPSAPHKATRFKEIYTGQPSTCGVVTSDEPVEPTLMTVCKAEGCDEPSRHNMGSSYCWNHRKRKPGEK